MRLARSLCLGISVVGAAAGTAQAISFDAPISFLGGSQDRFGNSVAASGSDFLVGASLVDVSGTNDAGAVYLFSGSTGAVIRTFLNPTPGDADGFGDSVAAFGSDVLVGAPGDDTAGTNAGAVYRLDGSTGALTRTFLNPTPGNDRFGSTVAVVGGNVLVGAPDDTAGGAVAGAAYLFDGTTGALIRTFLGGPDDRFGNSVAAVGSNILIGAYTADAAGSLDAGKAYLFDGATGTLIATFLNPTPAESDQFGNSVAALGSNVLVGAHRDNAGALVAGAAYLFNGGTGALIRTFLNPTPDVNDHFGASVAAVGTNVLVGAYGDAGGLNTGAAYLFDGSTGALLYTFANPTPASDDFFGGPIAAVGNNVLIGAFRDDTAGTDAGAAYRFNQTIVVPEPASLAILALGALLGRLRAEPPKRTLTS